MKALSVILLIFFGLSLVSCGEVTRLLTMQVTPITPLVIDQDFTEEGDSVADSPSNKPSVTYTANFIRFKIQMKNDHNKVITVLGFQFTVTDSLSGEKKSFNISVDKVIQGVTGGVKELAPGETLASSTAVANLVYLDGLPAQEGVENFSYKVDVKVRAWVGTQTKPEGRISSTYSFTTF